jgi:predicted PurR-regulated permease PerM
MTAFLPAFLGAITFYMLSRKSMRVLVEKRRWKKGLAALVILIVSFLVVVVPITFMVNILSGRIGTAISNSNQIVTAITGFIHKLELRSNIAILERINPANLSGTVANILRKVLSATFNSLASVAVMYFILYFMLIARKELEEWVYNFIPLKDGNVTVLGREMKSLVISMR